MTGLADTQSGSRAKVLRRVAPVLALLMAPCCGLDRTLTLDLTSESGLAGGTVAVPSAGAGTGGVKAGTSVSNNGGAFAGSDSGSDAGGSSDPPIGGAGGAATSTSAPFSSGGRASPSCNFAWGRRWDPNRSTGDDTHGTRPQPYDSNIGFFTSVIGWQDGSRLDGDSLRLLNAVDPNRAGALQGKTPVFYAPIIALRAMSDGSLKDCDPASTTPNLCTQGAEWIRGHRDYLRQVYDSYASDIAQNWDTNCPLIWLFEPNFSDYVRSSQSTPLSLEELSTVASDLIATVRSRLKNVLIGHHVSPDIDNLAEYFGALDLSVVHMVYVSGTATSTRYGASPQSASETATYLNLHITTGLPIFVDTVFGGSPISNHGWLSSDPSAINDRIADGVFAVYVDPAPDDMGLRIENLRPRLDKPDCQQ